MEHTWSVYIVRCKDGTLYTGVAVDVIERVDKHNQGKGAKYTRGRRPVRLIAVRKGLSQRGAYMLEYMVKQQKKNYKVPFLLGFTKPLPSC